MLEVVGWLVGGVAVVLCALLLAKRAESRGISEAEYEKQRSGGTALGNAMLATQALFEPGAKHVIEQRNVVQTDDAEAEGPPDPSGEHRR